MGGGGQKLRSASQFMSVNEAVTIFIAYIKVDAKLKFIRRVKGFIILKTQIHLLFKTTNLQNGTRVNTSYKLLFSKPKFIV